MHNTNEMSLFSSCAQRGLCSHAYIIDGAEGVGKLDFALYCARTLLCQSENKPCGVCESCRKALTDNHPDIFIIGKEKTALIADVREIIRRSALKPNDGEKQIFIICNAGKLRSDSQNALLKLFEEPPASVAIFLLTESRSSLLPTVLSRGQRIHLDGMRDMEMLQSLAEKYPTAPKSRLEQAAHLAEGNMGMAERLLSKERNDLREKAEKLITHALFKENYEVSSMLFPPTHKREQLYALLTEAFYLLIDAQKLKYGVGGNVEQVNSRILSANKKALACMGDAVFSCMTALENNGNVNAVVSKFIIEFLHAATK